MTKPAEAAYFRLALSLSILTLAAHISIIAAIAAIDAMSMYNALRLFVLSLSTYSGTAATSYAPLQHNGKGNRL